MHQHVAYLVGGNWWVPCYISVFSLLKNNQHIKFTIHLISEDGKDNPFFENVDQLNKYHSDFSLNHIHIKESNIDALPDFHGDWSKVVNSKLIMPDLLETDGSRLLYIDCDTLVLDNIENLLNIELNNCVLAASPEPKQRIISSDFSMGTPYFNVGVMLIDIDNWKNNNVSEKCIGFIEEYEPLLTEQTALNYVLHSEQLWKFMPVDYNFNYRWLTETDSNITDDELNMSILHFHGSKNPWHLNSDAFYDELWLDMYDDSPFEGFVPQYEHGKLLSTIEKWLKPYPLLSDIASDVRRHIG